ncbi:MAG: hypothetical protein WC010_04480 [Candidatus Absconditabacterales bacterium]
MKKLIFTLIVFALCFSVKNSSAQDEKTKSVTKSTLVNAQEETFKMVFDSLYKINDKINVDKVYLNAISRKTRECLEADLKLWGDAVIANAQVGKFKKYRLSFEKPENNNFKVPGKAKRKYTRAFKRVKKTFVISRKSKTLEETFADKNLKKYLRKTNKSFERQKNKCLKRIRK